MGVIESPLRYSDVIVWEDDDLGNYLSREAGTVKAGQTFRHGEVVHKINGEWSTWDPDSASAAISAEDDFEVGISRLEYPTGLGSRHVFFVRNVRYLNGSLLWAFPNITNAQKEVAIKMLYEKNIVGREKVKA